MTYSRYGQPKEPEPDYHRLYDVENANSRATTLSHILLPRETQADREQLLGSLGEIELPNGSIVVGPHSFAGFVDDANKIITSFAPKDRSHVAHFDRVYLPFAIALGYEFKNTDEQLLSGQPRAAYKLLHDKDVIAQLSEIFVDHARHPAAGRLRTSFAHVVEPFGTAQRIEQQIDWDKARANVSIDELAHIHHTNE